METIGTIRGKLEDILKADNNLSDGEKNFIRKALDKCSCEAEINISDPSAFGLWFDCEKLPTGILFIGADSCQYIPISYTDTAIVVDNKTRKVEEHGFLD